MSNEPKPDPDPVAQLLEEMGELERSVVAEATDGDAPAESARVAAWVESARRTSPHPGRRIPWKPLGLTSLAAAGLLAWSLGWFDPSSVSEPTAAGLRPVLIAPIGESSYQRFDWSIDSELPANTYFRLEVRDSAGSSVIPPVEDLRDSIWVPESSVESWPASIEWRVSVFRDGSLIDASHWGEAHRLP